MGAIQNSLNQITGSIASAAKTAVAIGAAKQLEEEAKNKGNSKANLEQKKVAKMTEIEAAERAFQELSDKIEAKQAMMSRAEKIMKRTGTWGGMK